MAVSPAQEAELVGEIGAISLLIELAEKGEIDPWDVRVIEAIDLALSQLTALHDLHSGSCEANLSQSGQVFLDASLLVLLKAKTLEELQLAQQEAQAELLAEELADFNDWGDPASLPRNLERQLRRRPAPAPPSSRRVTLQELIDQLRLVAAAIETKPPKVRSHNSSRSQSREVLRATMELAHEDNSVEVAAELERLLMAYWDSEDTDCLDLERLLGLWWQRKMDSRRFNKTSAESSVEQKEQNTVPVTDEEHHPVLLTEQPEIAFSMTNASSQEQIHERVNIFWALLLLSAQSKVELVQEEFYQDLKIRTLVEPVKPNG